MGLDIPGGFIFPAGAIQVLVALPSVQGRPGILGSAGMSSGSSTHSADSHPTQILGQGQKLFFPFFINFFPFFRPGAALGSVWRRLGHRISCFSSTRDVNIPEGKGKGGGIAAAINPGKPGPCQELSHGKFTARAAPSRSPGVLKEELHFGFKDVPTSNEGRASRLPLINKLAHQEAP